MDFYFLGGCSGGSNLRKRQGKSKPIFGDGFQFNRCFFCIFVWIPLLFVYFFKLCLLRAFYAFYQENHGLEVPRETRLEKLMRLQEVSKEMHGGNVELSTKTISGVHF